MSSRHLPPVRNLPHWTRVGFLDKSYVSNTRPPKHLQPLTRVDPDVDHLQPLTRADPDVDHLQLLTRADRDVAHLQPLTRAEPEAGHLQPLTRAGPEAVPGGGGERGCSPGDMVADTRVASLQKNITFLQQQHKDTLHKLHAEIDDLKRQNKDLQYNLIMDPPKLSRKSVTHPAQRGARPPTQGGDASSRGLHQEQPLPAAHVSSQDPRHTPSAAGGPEARGAGPADRVPGPSGGLITSLRPLRIHSNPVHPPRAPTLPECEVIIRQLYSANSLQSQEILRIKAVLRDIVFHKKISPENYILTKAFLGEGPRKASAADRFPQLVHKPLPKKTPRPAQARVSDGVVLPALKQSLSSTIAERQRRTQAAQRSRLKRTLL